MRLLKQGSIRQRLLKMNLVSLGIFFVMILGIFVADEYLHYKNFMSENISAQARIIGSNSAAAIMFNDSKSAEDILSSLTRVPEISQVFLYTKEGTAVAGYIGNNSGHPLPPAPRGYFERLEGRYFTVFQPIVMSGDTIGSIYLKYDGVKFYTGIMMVIFVIMVSAFGSAYLAALLFAKLQNQITGPIMELTKTMGAVSRDKDYSARVPVHTEDELGMLSGGFNDMLGQIQQWDAELVQHRQHLAELVKERTGQLQEVNERLQEELRERTRIEDELRRYRDELEKLVKERTTELQQSNEKLRKEISDRMKMEEELVKAQKLESLGILAGGIAHDFNNLMTAILGNISLAKFYANPESNIYRTLQDAENASLKTKALTHQLLTFAKGGAPVRTTIPLGDSIRETTGFVLRGSNVRCEFRIADDLWPVYADEGQISQVMHNLAINAKQAMPAGGTLIVTGENVMVDEGDMLPIAPGKYVRISVQDSGIGIPQEHMVKIFDPYFTTKQQGSGLGLASSYSIVKRHEGHLAVESKTGTGTTFTLYLPASEGKVLPLSEKHEERSRGSGRVLIMDDDEAVRKVAGKMLEEVGYSVEYAGDGAEAISLYEKAMGSGVPFDCVIMDLTVPGGMGGIETLERLQKIYPDIRAVVSSGYSTDPVLGDCRKFGFSGFVVKPYRIRDLSDTINSVIRGMAGP